MEAIKIEVRCDRCGAIEICEINPTTRKAVHVKRGAQVFARLVAKGSPEEKSRDLCEDCTTEFERFMKGERLESGWVDPESRVESGWVDPESRVDPDSLKPR